MSVAVLYQNMSKERIKYATGWYNQEKIERANGKKQIKKNTIQKNKRRKNK